MLLTSSYGKSIDIREAPLDSELFNPTYGAPDKLLSMLHFHNSEEVKMIRFTLKPSQEGASGGRAEVLECSCNHMLFSIRKDERTGSFVPAAKVSVGDRFTRYGCE